MGWGTFGLGFVAKQKIRGAVGCQGFGVQIRNADSIHLCHERVFPEQEDKSVGVRGIKLCLPERELVCQKSFLPFLGDGCQAVGVHPP